MGHEAPLPLIASPGTTPGSALIQFSNVSRAYEQGGKRIEALHDVNLSIAPGEFVAFAGKSGSGKSTLLNLTCGIDQPSTGEVRVLDKQLTSLTDAELTLLRRRHFGIIFQFFNLIPTLTALENAVLPLYFEGRPPKDARQRATTLLAEVGLAGREESYPDSLSGGEQQRIAIVRAVIHDPSIILADEPTGNLDSETGTFIMEWLRNLATRDGKTVLLVTHSAEALEYADRVVRLRDGRIVEG
jgi:putative ABC transport system ATP-binding protein